MIPAKVSLIVLACVFGGAVVGLLLRAVIPEHHLSKDSKDVIKLGMGLIATMTALVLGLVIATAKSLYDTQDAAIKHNAAKILLLDSVLSNYRPEANEARDLLRRNVVQRLETVWPEERPRRPSDETPDAGFRPQRIDTRILQLSPRNDTQRLLRSQALQLGSEIMETRWLILGGSGSTVPVPFLVVIVFWLTIIFAIFGLFAPRNATVISVLFLCALSVAGSIFLILELNQPFEGLIKVSSAPLRFALSHLGR